MIFPDNNLDAIISRIDLLRISPFQQGIKSYIVHKKIKRRLSVCYICNLLLNNNERKAIVVKKLIYNDKLFANKTLLKERISREYENMQIIRKCFTKCPEYGIPAPLYVYPEKYTIVTECISNALTLEESCFGLLSHVIGRINGNLSKELDAVSKCGQLLGCLHASSMLENQIYNRELEEIKNYLFLKIDKITSLINTMYSVYWAEKEKYKITQIIHFLEDQRNDTTIGSTIVRAHGDFTPANILIAGGLFYLIDFADSRPETTALDINCFLAYLEMLHLNKPANYSSKRIEALQRTFFDSYKFHVGSDLIIPPNELMRLYLLRYILTNLIMQLFDAQKSFIHKMFYKKRINRYMNKIQSITDITGISNSA